MTNNELNMHRERFHRMFEYGQQCSSVAAAQNDSIAAAQIGSNAAAQKEQNIVKTKYDKIMRYSLEELALLLLNFSAHLELSGCSNPMEQIQKILDYLRVEL